MAVDLRQEQQEHQDRQGGRRPASAPQPRGTIWTVALALVAVVAVGGVVTVFAQHDEPAPAGEASTLSYPEGASTTGREGGMYLIVPEPATTFTATAVGIREGGPYGLTAEFTDTSVGAREGGRYVGSSTP